MSDYDRERVADRIRAKIEDQARHEEGCRKSIITAVDEGRDSERIGWAVRDLRHCEEWRRALHLLGLVLDHHDPMLQLPDGAWASLRNETTTILYQYPDYNDDLRRWLHGIATSI